jgi:hypothetical protein
MDTSSCPPELFNNCAENCTFQTPGLAITILLEFSTATPTEMSVVFNVIATAEPAAAV